MLRLGVDYSVEDLVPHRGLMCLLDRIDGYGEDWLRASFTATSASTFAGAEGIPGWVGIEYMAQAAAAFAGIEQVQRGQRPAIGLLIGSRYYRCMLTNIPFDSRVEVIANLVMRDDNDFAAYDCALSIADRQIATCTLKAFRPRDLRDWLPGASND